MAAQSLCSVASTTRVCAITTELACLVMCMPPPRGDTRVSSMVKDYITYIPKNQ